MDLKTDRFAVVVLGLALVGAIIYSIWYGSELSLMVRDCPGLVVRTPAGWVCSDAMLQES